MNLELQNKIIVVSGGSEGISEGVAKVVAQEKAIPVFIGRNEADNAKTVELIQSNGGKCFHVVAELTKPEDCKKAIDNVIKEFGRIDGLVNSAGVNGVGLENGDYENVIASLHKNLVHYYLLAHYALPALKISKGAIVNITFKTAETEQGGTSAYAVSNDGRNALTREWAVELLKYNIRVNAVVVEELYTTLYEKWINALPGDEKKLEKIPLKTPLESRLTTIEEVANTIAFLLSERSSHTTGQLIHVNGDYMHLDRR